MPSVPNLSPERPQIVPRSLPFPDADEGDFPVGGLVWITFERYDRRISAAELAGDLPGPGVPCVYGLFTIDEPALGPISPEYVGQSINVATRLATHFNTWQTRSIYPLGMACVLVCGDAAEMNATESAEITRLRPRYNVEGIAYPHPYVRACRRASLRRSALQVVHGKRSML